MQEIKQIKLYPKIGKLYKFRSDNTSDVLMKYGYYYDGLVMCLEEDILKYLDKNGNMDYDSGQLKSYIEKNVLYRFEPCGCKQYYEESHIYSGVFPTELEGNLFLTISEVQELLLEAKTDD